MRLGWIAVVVALTGLGGCLDGGDGGGDEADGPDPGAGLATGPTGADAPAAQAPVQGEPDEVVVVYWDGALPPTACLPTGPNSCSGVGAPPVSGRERSLLIPKAPANWSGTLTMTWLAQAPTTASLVLAFQFYESCGEGCLSSTGESLVVRGQSPLVLEVDALEAPAGSLGVWVGVGVESPVPDPLYAQVHAGQDVHVEGLLLVSSIRSS